MTTFYLCAPTIVDMYCAHYRQLPVHFWNRCGWTTIANGLSPGWCDWTNADLVLDLDECDATLLALIDPVFIKISLCDAVSHMTIPLLHAIEREWGIHV